MKFKLNKSSEGEWFPIFGSEIEADGETIKYHEPLKDEKGRVCVRIADAETMDVINNLTRKKVAENIYNPKTRQMERITYYDQTPEQEKKSREMLWDHAIKAWEGILDEDGKPIPCTAEMKMKMMSDAVFARFIGRCLQIITGATPDGKALVKN